MTKIRKPILIFILCTLYIVAQAQNACEVSEKKLLGLFKILNDGNFRSGKPEDERKLELSDSMIYEEFSFILHDSNSIDYPFNLLKGYIENPISPDKKLHLISWNTTMGGTMENRTVLAQYIGSDKRIHVQNAKIRHGDEYPDQAVYFYDIIQFQSNHYLAFGKGKYSSHDLGYAIYNFKIENNVLIDTNNIFKDEGNTLYNGYDYFKPHPANLAPVYDPKRKTIYYSEQTDDIKKQSTARAKIFA